MADTTYTDFVGPLVKAAWLNDVNTLTYRQVSTFSGPLIGAGTAGQRLQKAPIAVDAITQVSVTALGLTDGAVLEAKGLNSPADMLGGPYRYDASSVAPSNPPSVVVPLVGAGRLLAIQSAVLASSVGAGQVGLTPTGDVAATTVQAAVAELDSEKLARRIEATNPTVQGWNVSFNNFGQTSTNYYNGAAYAWTINSATPWPVNGMVLNLIVEDSYNKDIVGGISAAPVAVGFSQCTYVKKVNGGSDFWGVLGILDVQTPGTNGTGGQGIAGITRGNWTGTNIGAGVRSVAENYSGRSGYGVNVTASMTGSTGAFFDNAFSVGYHCHIAKDYGFKVGGPVGAIAAIIPPYPFALLNTDETQRPWAINYTGGAECTQRQQGVFILASGVFPFFQYENTVAAANQKIWQVVVEADGTMKHRTLTDAGGAGSTAMQFVRTGTTPFVDFPSVGTTASAANAFLDNANNNRLLRSTSSLRYKTDVEPLDLAHAEKILDLDPIWYRSLASADNKDWSFYGLPAEGVAKIDPRFVAFGYQEDQYEQVEIEPETTEQVLIRGEMKLKVVKTDEDGKKRVEELVVPPEYEERVVPARYELRVKEGEKLRPDGVQYERLTVPLLMLLKKERARGDRLEAQLASLVARVEALEKKTP